MIRHLVLVMSLFTVTACSKEQPKDPAKTETKKVEPAPAPVATPTSGRFDISVTEKGFEPDKLRVKKGEAVKLAFTRKTEKTCATEVVIQLGDGQKIEKKLPLNETVEVEATFAKTGELRYACAMDMIAGVVTVE